MLGHCDQPSRDAPQKDLFWLRRWFHLPECLSVQECTRAGKGTTPDKCQHSETVCIEAITDGNFSVTFQSFDGCL